MQGERHYRVGPSGSHLGPQLWSEYLTCNEHWFLTSLFLCQSPANGATSAMAQITEVQPTQQFLDTAACLGTQTCFTKSFMLTALGRQYSLAWGLSLSAGEESSCLPCICTSRDGCVVEIRRARDLKAGVKPASENLDWLQQSVSLTRGIVQKTKSSR